MSTTTQATMLSENIHQIYDLPDQEFNEILKMSSYLNKIGNFILAVAIIQLIATIAICISSTSYIFAGVLSASISIIFTGALAQLIKKQRSLHAAQTIKISLTFLAISIATTELIYLCDSSQTKSYTALILFTIFFYSIFWKIFKTTKNSVLFNNNPPTHKQLLYIKKCREKNFFDTAHLPPSRIHSKSDKIFRICVLLGIILFFILSVLGFFGAVTKGIIDEINDASNPQEYVQKADQAMEKKNFGDAFNLYEKAAKQNLPEGIFNLGICYAEGIGCDEDFAKAYECFNHPDVKDAPLAKFYIGIMHYSGQGAPQDFQKAAELLKSAADSGVEAAQKFLGYQNGKMPDYDVPLAKLLKENFKQNEKN